MTSSQVLAVVNEVLTLAVADPERVDILVWTLFHPNSIAHRAHAYEVMSAYEVANMNLGLLIQWIVDGEVDLMKRAKSLGVMPSLSTFDLQEWLASFAWLCVVGEGKTNLIIDNGYQANWVCRARQGGWGWFGLGLDDETSNAQRVEGGVRLWFYIDTGSQQGDIYYRVCCLNRTRSWPGLSDYGVSHDWQDCDPYSDDNYEDDYE